MRISKLVYLPAFFVTLLSAALPAQAAPQCQVLYGGQTINVGSVCVDNTIDTLSVAFHTESDWKLGDMHLFIGSSLEAMPHTKTGNPQIGQFPLAANGDGGNDYVFQLPLGDYGVLNDTLVIAAHAVVSKMNLDGSMRSETAWGEGMRMVAKGNWATYFTYVIQTPPVVEPQTCTSTETAFAFGDQTLQDLGNRINRWGWQISVDAEHGFAGEQPLYAGAAHNDPSKGTHVGTFLYSYANGVLNVNYTLFSGFSLNETHVYAGNAYVSTGAPGQFGNTHDELSIGTMSDNFQVMVADPEGDGIYVVGHATVCIQ